MQRPHPIRIIVDDALFPAEVVDAVRRVGQLVGLWRQLALHMALDPGFHNLCRADRPSPCLDAGQVYYYAGSVPWHVMCDEMELPKGFRMHLLGTLPINGATWDCAATAGMLQSLKEVPKKASTNTYLLH